MKEQDKIIKHISLIKFKDPRVIQAIVYHPMLFAKRRMADPDDDRPIRIRYFGAFVQKYMRNKETYKRLSWIIAYIKAHPEVIKLFEDPTFATEKELRIYVLEQFNCNNKEVIDTIYDSLKAIEQK